jgi:hypothetical protein
VLIKLVLLVNKNHRERAMKLSDTTHRARGREECSGLGAVQVLIEVYFPEAEHIGVVLDRLNTPTLAGQEPCLVVLLPRERERERLQHNMVG